MISWFSTLKYGTKISGIGNAMKSLKRKIQCPNTKISSLDMILSHLVLLHIRMICLRNIHFHFVLPFTSRSLRGYSPRCFSSKFMHSLILPSMLMKKLSYAQRQSNKAARLVTLCDFFSFKCMYSGDTDTGNYVFRLTRRRIICHLPGSQSPAL
jgi:hypothetical protein